MFTSEEELGLDNLGDGLAVEKFNICLQEVLNNIADPNKDPKAVRKVVLEVAIKPNDERTVGTIAIHCYPKLATDKAAIKACVLDSKHGKGFAREIVDRQQKLFTDDEKIVDIKTGEIVE